MSITNSAKPSRVAHRNLWAAPEDAKCAEQLVQAIRAGRALGFIGAGVSKAAGYPTWGDLLDKIHDLLDAWSVRNQRQGLPQELKSFRNSTLQKDYLWRAEEYVDFVEKDVFLTQLRRAFRS